MEVWFNSEPFNSFELFGSEHHFMIMTYLLGIIILLFYSKKMKEHARVTNTLRWGFFILLVTSEASYQVWGMVNQDWNPPEFLPFQLCSMAGIITMLALLTKNDRLIQIILFIAIVPSFLAVVTPELHHGFPQFRFWQFFIHHIVLSWSAFFLVLTRMSKITLKDTIMAYTYLLCYAAIIGFIINPGLDANYLFLARTPSVNTPLNHLGDGAWYYFNLCAIGLFVYLAILGLYRLLNYLLSSDKDEVV
ncbi:TIGR02206 family membrane protein [Ornithinibacillus scapharcae]|uniref:YwaF family protein n=1 Tax=Ornithinibacillus scapharcae TaxID=1147159 RepID=UPI000225B6CE|nr:TIGR02206 family membrane protein [Ornithinibacillus scapharcae]